MRTLLVLAAALLLPGCIAVRDRGYYRNPGYYGGYGPPPGYYYRRPYGYDPYFGPYDHRRW